MVHQLKYYKEIDSHDHLWRVEILQETEDTLTPMEIGPVLQGLRLVVQGDQADVDTPIVKTSLEMTFVDAPDLEEERKCGYWEEFYTSSATEYQVKLYKDGQIEWTGYVTPDSFSENLRYRGSVTIIARDNLGALQDYQCNFAGDANGMISLYDLVRRSCEEVSFAMDIYDDYSQQNISPRCDEATVGEQIIYYIKFNASAFQGKNLWEALDGALMSTGMVLRYIGENTYVFQPIRAIGLMNCDFWPDVPVKKVLFEAYATRELSPSVKNIREDENFDLSEEYIIADSTYEAYGVEGTAKYYDEFDMELGAPSYAIVNGYNFIGAGFQGADVENSRLLNPFLYPIKREHSSAQYGSIYDNQTLYVLANTFDESGYYLIDDRPVVSQCLLQFPGKYILQPHIGYPVSLYNNNQYIGNFATKEGYAKVGARFYCFRARFEGADGSVQYLVQDGDSWLYKSKWSSERPNRPVCIGNVAGSASEFDCASFADLSINIPGLLTIEFYSAAIDYTYFRIENSAFAYLRYKGVSISISEDSTKPLQMEKRTITTEYSKKNNLILNRTPQFACNPSEIISPISIKNGLFVKNEEKYFGSDFWVFNVNDVARPLATLIHQQILCYYARPNNVLNGNLIGQDYDFKSLYEWEGKIHLLMSGTLNVLTGRMENAVLREFMRYDHMWETWVENEDETVDYTSKTFTLKCHSGKELTDEDVTQVPSWLTFMRFGPRQADGTVLAFFRAMANASGQERSAIFQIDTAWVRVTQRAAGDYGTDYGKDYL
jgi:hypothetical protein